MSKPQIMTRPLPRRTPGAIRCEAGRTLSPDEQETVQKLAAFGEDIVCQKESNQRTSADIIWRGELWELKNPLGATRHTIKNNLRKAKRQSGRIIIDISRSRILLSSAINHSRDHMRRTKQVREIILIARDSYCLIDRSMLK